MMIIDGKKEAEILRQEIKKEIESLKSKNNNTTGEISSAPKLGKKFLIFLNKGSVNR